jgi:glycosyltransferase involved in cell wall biosynthesis
MTQPRRIYFYNHAYMRERQLDTIRTWPRREVVNFETFEHRIGRQVTRGRALTGATRPRWVQRIPLVNLKRRPAGLGRDVVVYSWGAVIVPGPFILDLDNPYALTAYNLSAMPVYCALLRRVLVGNRCIEIRCLSAACRETLRLLFGDRVYDKAVVRYPRVPNVDFPRAVDATTTRPCRFLFVATQFEIKGGAALLRAFRRVARDSPGATLDIVSHVPPAYRDLVADCPGITVHEAEFSRQEIADRFLRYSDVLVHPTYVESFGMVALEALAHGLALVATDVYALGEMVHDRRNGRLLQPPVSIWDGYLPSRHYYRLASIADVIRRADTSSFEARLGEAMLELARDRAWRSAARVASRALYEAQFARAPAESVEVTLRG